MTNSSWLGLGLFLVSASFGSQSFGQEGDLPSIPQPSPTPSSTGETGNQSQNQQKDYQTDPFTGRFSYKVPIEVPPGRGGSEPKIALGYTSSSGNSWCGYGWSLDMGTIQRDSAKGVPIKWSTTTGQPMELYDDSLGFTASFHGISGRLVKLSTSPLDRNYGLEIESGFVRFEYTNPNWTVTDRSGNKFHFGSSVDSRMENLDWNAVQGARTFAWKLDKIVDAKGNITDVYYEKQAGQIYLKQIAYNGHTAGLPTTHFVDFILDAELRPDKWTSFVSGKKVKTSKRLDRIEVRIASTLVRSYKLKYEKSPATSRSLLKEVALEAPSGASLPPRRFAYQGASQLKFEDTVTWGPAPGQGQSQAKWHSVVARDDNRKLVDLMDINRDGLPDRVMADAEYPYNGYVVQRNTGNGFSGEGQLLFDPADTNLPKLYDFTRLGFAYVADKPFNKENLLILDMNGDGFLDRLIGDWDYTTNQHYKDNFRIELGKPGGFGLKQDWGPVYFEEGLSKTKWQVPQCSANDDDNFLNSTLVAIADMNGDGLPDRVNRGSSNPENWKVQINTGSGFLKNSTDEPIVRKWFQESVYEESGQAKEKAWNSPIASGWGYATSAQYNFIKGAWTGETDYVEIAIATLIDINGDGLPDRVMRKKGAPRDVFKVQFNNGAGFEATEDWGPVLDPDGDSDDEDWLAPDSTWWESEFTCEYTCYTTEKSPRIQLTGLFDVNGDGLPDRVMLDPDDATRFLVQRNTGTGFEGTLTAITNVKTQGGDFEWGGFISTNAKGNDTFCSLADMNGDGLIDRVMRKKEGPYNEGLKVQLMNGRVPDLLGEIDNGTGGKIEVAYKPSTALDNKDENGSSMLGALVYVTESVTAHDGMGNSYETRYEYRGGYFDTKKRELRGFWRVSQTDPEGSTVKTYFHQGGGIDDDANGELQDEGSVSKLGKPYRTESWGSDGKLYKVTIQKVEEFAVGDGRFFPYVSRTIEMDYEGLSTFRARAKDSVFILSGPTLNFGSVGQLRKQIDYGEVVSVDASTHGFVDLAADGVAARYFSYHKALPDNSDIQDRLAHTVQTDETGAQVTLQQSFFDKYNANGLLLEKRDWLNLPAVKLITEKFTYDKYGNLETASDWRGIVTKTEYESSYRIFPNKTIQDFGPGKLNFTTTVVTDARSGKPFETTDASGLKTVNHYDAFLRLEQSSLAFPDGSATWLERHIYNLGGIDAYGKSQNYTRVEKNDGVDSLVGHVSYSYKDGLERQIQSRVEAENGLWRVSNTAYDSRGEICFQSRPFWSTGTSYTAMPSSAPGTQYFYDPIRRTREIVPPAGEANSPTGSVSILYTDGTDPWTSIAFDASGAATRATVDARGRTVRIEQGSPPVVTQFQYDLRGNQTVVTDHMGNQLLSFYDSLGRKLATQDPDMGLWVYEYDENGNLLIQTDAKGNKSACAYDNLNRKYDCKTVLPGGAIESSTKWSYDTSQGDSSYSVFPGDLYRVDDSQGWIKFGYDIRGNVLRSTRFLNKTGQAYTTESSYNEAGNPRTRIFPGGATAIEFQYDTAAHLSKVRSLFGPLGDTTLFQANSFDDQNSMTQFQYGNGTQTDLAYYPESKRLQRLTVSGSSGSLQDLEYSYDVTDNLRGITDKKTPSGKSSGSVWGIEYDSLYRLKRYSRDGGARTQRIGFEYDAIGNLLQNDESGPGNYAYGSSKPHAVTSANGKNYAYDACGNMTQRGRQKLDYDGSNRLVRVMDGATITSFGYDHAGARLWKESDGKIDIWIDGAYEERDGKKLCHVLAGDRRVCTFEIPDSSLGGLSFGKGLKSLTRYYHQDHLQGTSLVTDKKGSVTEKRLYYAFGKDWHVDDPDALFDACFEFTGQIKDKETGLYFYNARYYDPELARFIQPDTVIPDASDSQAYNRYSYVQNNPFKYNDPSGNTPSVPTPNTSFSGLPMVSYNDYSAWAFNSFIYDSLFIPNFSFTDAFRWDANHSGVLTALQIHHQWAPRLGFEEWATQSKAAWMEDLRKRSGPTIGAAPTGPVRPAYNPVAENLAFHRSPDRLSTPAPFSGSKAGVMQWQVTATAITSLLPVPKVGLASPARVIKPGEGVRIGQLSSLGKGRDLGSRLPGGWTFQGQQQINAEFRAGLAGQVSFVGNVGRGWQHSSAELAAALRSGPVQFLPPPGAPRGQLLYFAGGKWSW